MDDLDTEVEFHLEETVETLVAQGWTEASARAEAERRFGDRRRLRRDVVRWHRPGRTGWLTALAAVRRWRVPIRLFDVRVALRMLARRPFLAIGRLLTVTIVVAAASAVFAVANATFLRPLPFPDAERMLLIYSQPPGTDSFDSATPLHPLTFARLQHATTAFADIQGQWSAERAISDQSDPESVQTGRVSSGLFRLLGGSLVLGRTFSEEEARLDARVVVLSHGLWRRRFGGAPSAIGGTLQIDRQPYTVIGVMEPTFVSAFVDVELWTPLHTAPFEKQPFTSIRTLGVLKPGASVEQARGELQRLFQPIRDEAPQVLDGWAPGVIDFRDALFGERRPALYMLLAAVCALMLIAIANLTNLTIADVLFRRNDFAVRAAIGGGRRDLAAPEVAQSLLVAGAGGLIGLWIASLSVPVLIAQDPSSLFTSEQIGTDWRVAACGLAVSGLVMLLAVGLPVLRTAGPAIAAGVTSGSRRSTSGPGARRTRALLVSLQTAMTMMLLSAGALVVLTLDHSSRTDPGMDPHNVVTAQLRLAENAFPTVDARAAFIERVLANVRAVPDVVSAGTTMNLFTTGGWFQTLVHVEDRPTANGVPHTVQFRRVSPGLFGALGMTIRRGRDFDAHDTTGGQPVAIVSRAFAHRFWPGEDPIGKRVKRGSTANAWSVVVGEVNDVRDVSLDQRPGELVYVPVLQNNAAAAPVSLVVRTASNPGPMVPAIKRAVWAVDPQQPLGNVITLDEFLSDMLGPQRLRAILIGLCGLLGLVLAIIGTYGMTARSVSERQREIGIRLALGGSRTWVWWAMAMSSVRAVGGGVVCGVVLSAAAAKGLSALIPDLQGGVVATSAVLAAVLITTGVGAALCAAHSAARVELLSALRSE